MQSTFKPSPVAVVLMALFASTAQAEYRFGPETFGSNGRNSFTSSGNQVFYGLGGNDTFTARAGAEEVLFVGGAGNDTYIAASGSSVTIADIGGGRDTLRADGIGLFSDSTIAGEYLGKHLIVVDTSSGSLLFAVHWRDSANTVERIILSDETISGSFLKANISRLPGFFGNVSQSQIRSVGFLVPNSADTAEAVSYYSRRARSRGFAEFGSGLSLHSGMGPGRSDWQGVSLGIDGVALSFERNPWRADALEVIGSGVADALYSQSASVALRASDVFSLALATPWGGRLEGAVARPFVTGTSPNDDPFAAGQQAESGVKWTLPLVPGVSVSAGWRVIDRPSALTGMLNGMSTMLTRSQTDLMAVGLNWQIRPGVNFSSSYSFGSTDPGMRRNRLFSTGGDWRVDGFSLAATFDGLHRTDDRLALGVSQPLAFSSATLTDHLAGFLSGTAQTTNLAVAERPLVLEMSYSVRSAQQSLGLSLRHATSTLNGFEPQTSGILSLTREF